MPERGSVDNSVQVSVPAEKPAPRQPRKDQFPDMVRVVLDQAEEFDLYSLEPADGKGKEENSFHGWKVLGKTRVADFDARGKILAAVDQGLADNESSSEPGCFQPRHGIRVVYVEQVVELVICFQCSQIKVFVDGKEDKTVLTAKSPQPLLDKVLADAGVPLARKPG